MFIGQEVSGSYWNLSAYKIDWHISVHMQANLHIPVYTHILYTYTHVHLKSKATYISNVTKEGTPKNFVDFQQKKGTTRV